MRNFLFCIFILLTGSTQAAEPTDLFTSPAGHWKDETDTAVQFSDYKSPHTIVTMAYTECKKTCPYVTLAKLKELQSELDARQELADFIVVTMDPENDTPEVLREFKKKHHLERSNWHFLSSSKSETRQAAQALGLAGYWTMDEHVIHDFRILIFDKDKHLESILDWKHPEVRNFLALLPSKSPDPKK